MASAHTAASAPNLLSIHRHIQFSQITTSSNRLRNAPFSNSLLFPTIHAQSCSITHIQRRFSWQLGASSTGEGISTRSFAQDRAFDGFLSAAEFLCIVPPALYSITFLIGLFVPNVAKLLGVSPASKLFVSQYLFLLGAVVIGNLIRWRQWKRLCFINYRGTGVDMISRIERVEDDLKSSSRITSLLSRQLEKLGIRFRVTKKALQDPISEMAALAQKNSEATRALADQKDLLGKELGEIQYVLLAMQVLFTIQSLQSINILIIVWGFTFYMAPYLLLVPIGCLIHCINRLPTWHSAELSNLSSDFYRDWSTKQPNSR